MSEPIIRVENLNINGNTFHLVKSRDYVPVSVYIGDGEFLRIGSNAIVTKEVKHQKKLLKLGFPLAKIKDHGKIGNKSYFIEESLGDRHFGYIFSDDIKKTGKISNRNFSQFLKVCVTFAKAQLNTRSKRDLKSFRLHTNFPYILKELPMLRSKTLTAFSLINEKIRVLPYVLTHGDFGPFNIYPKGVIDLEHSFEGPLGYDLITPIFQTYFFPVNANYEFRRIFSFSTAQQKRYFDTMDKLFLKVKLPKLSNYSDEYILCKCFWAAARMQGWPKLQAWRYKQFGKILNAYLNKENLAEIIVKQK